MSGVIGELEEQEEVRSRKRFGGIPTSRRAWCGALGTATLALGCVIAFGKHEVPAPPPPAPVVQPLPAPEPFVMEGALVQGAANTWYAKAKHPVRAGDPVPVVITAYCLSGTTRRGRYVRPGIVAADPRFFPLSRFIELYAGTKYLGRFLVDDTGSNIRRARIDIWMPTCREAVIFGRQKGTAVLVARPEIQVVQAGAPR
jgi:3D (Asp-Asp-Asp) domain-containing protein